MVAVVMFVCILVSSAATHSRIRYLHRAPERTASMGRTFREIASVFSKPGSARPDGSSVLGGAGIGITSALQNYFYLHLWGLKPQMIGPLQFGGMLASVIGVFPGAGHRQAVRQEAGDDRPPAFSVFCD